MTLQLRLRLGGPVTLRLGGGGSAFSASSILASSGFSSAFSSDLVSTTAFRYVAAPRVEQSDADKERDAAQRRVLREDSAVGDYAGGGGTTLVYRTRKKGAVGGSNGWKIVTEKLAEPKTRTELLEMRSKYKSDRHCG